MKKPFVMCLIFLMLFSLCACSNQSAVDITEQPPSSLDPAAGAPASQLPQQLTTNITLDAELPQNTGKVDILTVGLASIDMEAAKQLLLAGKEITNHVQSGATEVYTTSDGSTMSATGSFFSFDTNFSIYINNVFKWSKNDTSYNADTFLTNKDLGFCPIDEAKMQIADVLHSMGIDSIDRSTVYTLDHAMLAEAETAKKNNPDYAIDIQNGQIKFKDSWTENDDCYFFVMECCLHNIPIIADDFERTESGTIMFGNRVLAILSKDGIQHLQMINIYRELSVEGQCEIISSEQALETVVKKLDSIITSNQYTIGNVELRYVPEYADKQHTDLRVIPAWCFSIEENAVSDTGDSSYVHEYILMIDASNGSEII